MSWITDIFNKIINSDSKQKNAIELERIEVIRTAEQYKQDCDVRRTYITCPECGEYGNTTGILRHYKNNTINKIRVECKECHTVWMRPALPSDK